MVRLYLYAFIAAVVAGCAGTGASGLVPVCEPKIVVQRVEVPVPVARSVPPQLATFELPPAPVFVSPGTEGVTSALTPEGEAALRAYVEALGGQLGAWQAWGSTPLP